MNNPNHTCMYIAMMVCAPCVSVCMFTFTYTNIYRYIHTHAHREMLREAWRQEERRVRETEPAWREARSCAHYCHDGVCPPCVYLSLYLL